MSLQDEIYAKIKEEISNDPFNIGYAGKSDKEIQELLNNPVVKDRVVQDVTQSPMNRILSGLSSAPNIVSEQDVTDSKK